MEEDQCEGKQGLYSWSDDSAHHWHEGQQGLHGFCLVEEEASRLAHRAQWLFIRSTQDGLATVWAGHDALRRSTNASWFEWLEGLAPFFWNWGAQYQRGL